MLTEIKLPIASPPWTKLGRKMESMFRKAAYDFNLLNEVDTIAVALSGGKDSLSLLYLLHALSGHGFPKMKIHAIHVSGEFSCGASLNQNYLKSICDHLDVNLINCQSGQKKETLNCYSCSRERRRLIFNAAKEAGATTIAFGHHRDDSIQTALLNLLHKGEFAGNLPKVHMQQYGVTIIRPLIYITEQEIKDFASHYGFARITCQCPIGQKSKRYEAEKLISLLEDQFPNARVNFAHAIMNYGSNKAETP